jgi:WhiB family transcriptional regulator, redox-sensing transcriptional regulator
MSADIMAALLGAIHGAPDLPRAACRGRSDLFDGRTEDDVDEAIEVCETLCPEFLACRAWAQSQPRRRICGVIAGRMYEHKPPRQRKAS